MNLLGLFCFIPTLLKIGLSGILGISQIITAFAPTSSSSIDILPPPEATTTTIAIIDTAAARAALAASAEAADLIVEVSDLYDMPAELPLAIAECESRLRHYNSEGEILRGRRNPSDVGLFQINERYHLAESRELGLDIYTPEGNAAYALWLLKKDGSRPWRYSAACWRQKVAAS